MMPQYQDDEPLVTELVRPSPPDWIQIWPWFMAAIALRYQMPPSRTPWAVGWAVVWSDRS